MFVPSGRLFRRRGPSSPSGESRRIGSPDDLLNGLLSPWAPLRYDTGPMKDIADPLLPPVAPPSFPAAAAARLVSVDVLRGFDMIWIIGLEEVVKGLCKARPGPVTGFIANQLDHADWEGFRFYDLIFPLFVFLAGVSLVFSLGKIVEQGGRAAALRRVFRRSLIIYFLGVFSYDGIASGLDHVRWVGVLQRIAISYFFAALIFLGFKGRAKPMATVCFGILLAYWAFLSFVPVPGGGEDHFAVGKNWPNYIDQRWLPGRRWDGTWDPEGLLSSLPAISTCLLGVFGGLVLRHPSMSSATKVSRLLIGGAILAAAGYAWGLQFPVIKKLWTSSYVLVAGGFSYLLLGAFFQVVDVWKVRSWTLPFLWVGTNAITAYLAANLIEYGKIAERLAGGEIKAAAGAWGDFLIAAVAMALTLIPLRFLYRRGIFLRI
jgi:predicted acyltransferase